MKLTTLKIETKISDFLYYIFIILMILNDGLGNSVLEGYSVSLIHDILLLFEFAFAILCFFQQKYEKIELICYISLLIFGIASYVCGQRTGFFLFGLAVILGKKADLDAILRIIFWEKLAIFLFIVSLSLVGVLGGVEALTEASNSVMKGVTLGYGHANTFSANVVTILLLYIAINRNYLRISQTLVILAIEILNYRLTESRIGAIVIIGVVVIYFFGKNLKLEKLVLKLAKYAFPCILLLNFSFILARIFWDNSLLSDMDMALFNGRMGLSAIYLSSYPLTMFGDVLDISVVASKIWYYAFDNGYSIILLFYGVAGFFAYIYIYQKTMLEMIKKRELLLVVIIIFYMFWGIYEGITISVSGNFTLLILGKKIPLNKNIGNKYIGRSRW